jgi:hypothetical protein
LATKHEIAEQLKERGDISTRKMMGELLDCLLQEAREAQDNAKGDEFLTNQGKVHLCKDFKAFLSIE